jgi:hypothetical protein
MSDELVKLLSNIPKLTEGDYKTSQQRWRIRTYMYVYVFSLIDYAHCDA